MCGIVGLIDLEGVGRDPIDDAETIKNMLELISHRGPDQAGRFVSSRVGLGVVRLRILDLQTGAQPLNAADGRFWIAYNGEVYNYLEIRTELVELGHQFSTTTDTEVVLHAWMQWGAKALDKLNGGFAFAIYDAVEDCLWLARDRFGKRPLFYTTFQGKLYFASEMKAFLGIKGFNFQFDLEQVRALANTWTPVEAQTGFQSIKQLPAGSYVNCTPAGCGDPVRYWSFPVESERSQQSFDDATDELRALLQDAVQLRMRSDVEVGTYLSGGLDSTITTALAQAVSPNNVRSFSVGFDAPEYDETSYQASAASHLGVQLHSERISSSDILDNLPRALWHAEFPQFRSAFVPLFLLSRSVSDNGIKVVLTGEGADEIFLGYDLFKETLLRKQWSQLSSEERTERLLKLYPYLDLFSKANSRALAAVFGRFSDNSQAPLFSHLMRFENGRFATKFLHGDSDGTIALETMVRERGVADNDDVLKRAQWIEAHTLMEGYLLSSQGDRSSFAHGVEARCPFLDYRIVEWASSLPSSYHLGEDFTEKKLLKAAFANVISPEIIDRPKQPYRAPGAGALSDIFANSYKGSDVIMPYLTPDALGGTGIINADLAINLVEKIRRTPANRLSAREDQAFMFVLSLSILHQLFVHRAGLNFKTGLPPFSVDEVSATRP